MNFNYFAATVFVFSELVIHSKPEIVASQDSLLIT